MSIAFDLNLWKYPCSEMSSKLMCRLPMADSTTEVRWSPQTCDIDLAASTQMQNYQHLQEWTLMLGEFGCVIFA